MEVNKQSDPWRCECGSQVMLADTEDWAQQLCFECWIDCGGPDEEPASPVHTATMARAGVFAFLIAHGHHDLATTIAEMTGEDVASWQQMRQRAQS